MSELLVPVRLDALTVTKRERVTGPRQNYEALPWFDGTRDHNTNTPPLASAIEAEPFAGHDIWLEPGTHLHWALPDGLTRGSTGVRPENIVHIDGVWMPHAPNRWLVKRFDANKKVDRAWLVESDYVHAGKHRPNPHAIAYPRQVPRAGHPPFFYLGRQIELEPGSMQAMDHGDVFNFDNRMTTHGPALTALGAGDPMFAAHYPSSRSVFGLYDDTPPTTQQTYLVYGWYASHDVDPLFQLRQHLKNTPDLVRHHLSELADKDPQHQHPDPNGPLSEAAFGVAFGAALKQRFNWSLDVKSTSNDPDTILCVGETVAQLRSAPVTQSDQDLDLTEVAIGATPSEAFAAYALHQDTVTPADFDRVINVLEGTDLAAHSADLAAKLEEARHSGQFVSLRGHMDWAIRPAENTNQSGLSGLHLPDDLAEALNTLNAAQRTYDTAQRDIDGLRQKLFDDWSAWLSAMMPEDDTHGFGPEVDGLRKLMERDRLLPLEQLLDRAGHLYFGRDGAGHDQVVDATSLAQLGAVRAPGFAGQAQGKIIRDELDNGAPLRGFLICAKDAVEDIIPLTSFDVPPRASDSNAPRHLIPLQDGEALSEICGMQAPAPSSGREGVTQTRDEILSDIAACLGQPAKSTPSARGIYRLELRTSFGRVLGPYDTGDVPEGYVAFRQKVPEGMVFRGTETFYEDRVKGLGMLVGPKLAHANQDRHHDTLAHDVVLAYSQLHALLEETRGDTTQLALALTPGPRYYAPHDPVVLMDSSQTRASQRLGGGEELACRALKFVRSWSPKNREFAVNERAPLGLDDVAAQKLVSASISAPEMWHPIEVEWQAELFAQAEGSNVDAGRYDPDFLATYNTMPDDHMDLIAKDTNTGLRRTYQFLSGRAILNGSGGRHLANRWNKTVREAAPHFPASVSDAMTRSVRAPMVLPLGGFHDRLVMRHHLPQLKISDPTALPYSANLLARVRDAIGSYHPTSPLLDGAFHPIRSGEMTLQHLRVIDSFGRTRSGRPTKIHKPPTRSAIKLDQDRVLLPMRLSQPARLNFRWLSAKHGQVESGLHPAASPVLGWLAVDELDGAIAVYDGDGRFLGKVNRDANWTAAPGDVDAPRSVTEVKNPVLRRMMGWLMDQNDPSLIAAFIETLNATLTQIDPVEAAAHQARALLISRPIAIVHARLSLEMQHGLTEDRSARALRARLAGQTADSHGVGDVKVPVRLGEHGHFSDGLCGYWQGGDSAEPFGTFTTAPSLAVDETHGQIITPNGADLHDLPLHLTLDGPAQDLIVLMDPHGSIHASTGILPVKSVSLPPEFYQDQIASLRMTFPTGPILTPSAQLEVPLPAEPGYSWSWLERTQTGWSQTPHHATLARADLVAAVGPKGGALWMRLMEVGQLEPISDSPRDADDIPTLGHVVPAGADAAIDRFDDLGLSAADVARHLHALVHQIDNTVETARFDDRTRAAFGWLQLRASPTAATDTTPIDTQEGDLA